MFTIILNVLLTTPVETKHHNIRKSGGKTVAYCHKNDFQSLPLYYKVLFLAVSIEFRYLAHTIVKQKRKQVLVMFFQYVSQHHRRCKGGGGGGDRIG